MNQKAGSTKTLLLPRNMREINKGLKIMYREPA